MSKKYCMLGPRECTEDCGDFIWCEHRKRAYFHGASCTQGRRYLLVMAAGCHRNWRPVPGSNASYIHWLAWERVSEEHGMAAGCHRNWGHVPGSNASYMHWRAWERMSEEHGISAEEADAAWNAFLKRHGDRYPGGEWQEREREYMKTLPDGITLCEYCAEKQGGVG